HREELRYGSDDRLDRRLHVAGVANDLADLERQRNSVGRRRHHQQPQLRRRDTSGWLNNIRPDRYGHHTQLATESGMHRTLTLSTKNIYSNYYHNGTGAPAGLTKSASSHTGSPSSTGAPVAQGFAYLLIYGKGRLRLS